MSQARSPQVLRSASRYLRLRIELLELEISDERERLGALLTRSLLFALTAFLGIELIAVLVIAASWYTTWRLPVIAAVTAFAALATVLSWRALTRVRKPKPQQPLSSLLQDIDALLSSEAKEEKLQ